MLTSSLEVIWTCDHILESEALRLTCIHTRNRGVMKEYGITVDVPYLTSGRETLVP